MGWKSFEFCGCSIWIFLYPFFSCSHHHYLFYSTQYIFLGCINETKGGLIGGLCIPIKREIYKFLELSQYIVRIFAFLKFLEHIIRIVDQVEFASLLILPIPSPVHLHLPLIIDGNGYLCSPMLIRLRKIKAQMLTRNYINRVK